jgi:putative membrane protein
MNKRLYPIWASLFILVLFTIIYLIQGNYEFLAYILTLGIAIFIIFKADKFFKFPGAARWGFAIWMLLHMLGGSLFINGKKLYDTVLINIIGDPYFILKYDQFVHAFCYFVITLFVYSLVVYISKSKILTKTSILIIILAGIGIGAINEMIEFATVVFLNSTGVGGYTNNALDLFFNSIGAILSIFYIKNRDN